MFNTPNMGLVAWDLEDDPYDHTQLATNFNALDQHDHTTGRGRQVPRGGIANSAIDSSKIALNAVIPDDHIPDDSISQLKLEEDSVGAPQIIDGAVGSDEIADGSIFLRHLNANLLPLGTVMMWYRPNSSISPPTGWEICDGRAWSQVPNAWNIVGGFMPDMRDRFPVAALTLNGIGVVGGSATADLTHSHIVSPHSHTVFSHAHAIGLDGGHRHRWQTTLWSGNQPAGTTFTDGMQRGTAVPAAVGTRQSFYIPDLNRGEYYGENVGAPMETTGDHSHGGATGTSGAFQTSADGTSTSNSLGAVNVRPPFITLLFIMRVN